jgi:hypothetical protein
MPPPKPMRFVRKCFPAAAGAEDHRSYVVGTLTAEHPNDSHCERHLEAV